MTKTMTNCTIRYTISLYRALIYSLILVFSATTNLYGQLTFKYLTINDGLSQNVVLCMIQDKEGFIWIGTEDGLNRYDGYEFKHYKNSVDDKNTISNSSINAIVENSNGDLWIATADGLNFYDRKLDKFNRINTISKSSASQHRDFISMLLLDNDYLWIGTIEGIKKYNWKQQSLQQVSTNKNNLPLNLDNRSQSAFKANNGTIWLGTNKGIQIYDAKTNKLLETPKGLHYVKNEFIRVIKQDNLGRIWIGTENSGAFIYNPNKDSDTQNTNRFILPNETIRDIYFASNDEVWFGTMHGLSVLKEGKVSHYAYNSGLDIGLSHSSVRCILKDKAGNIWLGTYYGGVNLALKGKPRFNLITEKSKNNDGLNHPVVSSILELGNNEYYIGTEGGGLNLYDKNRQLYNAYKVSSNNRILGNIIKSLTKLNEQNIWVGTYGGLKLFNIKWKTFVDFKNVSDSTIKGSEQIYALHQAKNGLWIGTNGGGLRFLSNKGDLEVFMFNDQDKLSISSNNINGIVEDKNGNLWLATSRGLNYFNTTTKKSKAYFYTNSNKTSLSNNFILTVFIDSKHRVWVGTDGGGLNCFYKDKFIRFTENDGVANNVIHAINEDQSGNIWISTNKGISRLHIKDNKLSFDVMNFSVEDGLQSNQFGTGTTLKSKSGLLFFGGIKGITSFNPSDIGKNNNVPEVALTEILIKDKAISLVKDVDFIDNKIRLKYDHGSITFKFSALNFLSPKKNKYAYKLEGLANDEDWHYVTSNQRLATYTNLAPGKYIFKIKAANNDGVWNDVAKEIKITVEPPIWGTWWANCIYAIIIIALLYVFYYYSLKTAKLKNDLEFEHLSHIKDQELAEQKLNFFTNISHEIKTPLTLILAPLENMINTSRAVSKTKDQLLMMQRNGERLMSLISQLLDFRKFESGYMLLKNKENDLVLFLQEICLVFKEYANKQAVSLVFKSDVKKLIVWFDEDKLEKIVSNLLSNAIKFSNPNGVINIRLKLDKSDSEFILIDVEDNGIGISEENIDKIFNQFHYSKEIRKNTSGTGIGLAFSKGLAELLGGDLSVKSKRQKKNKNGFTCFTLKLPLIKNNSFINDIVFEENSNLASEYLPEEIKSPLANTTIEGDFTMLVVEDNKDLLEFLVSTFSDKFTVYSATNGLEGLNKLKEIKPDIIISDVMMPEMDGIEFCKRVKSDAKLSQIPIILLTARAPSIYKIEGFETGADDYITKPFSIDVLSARVNNLIASRRKILAQYKTELISKPTAVNLTSPDEILLSNVMSFIEQNLVEPELNVEEMAKQVGMSRSALYRKIKALTGKTAIEFIRSVRIRRAGQLLKQKKLNISEVVYKVGFTDVDYFRKCFKEEFGLTPRDYINKSEAE